MVDESYHAIVKVDVPRCGVAEQRPKEISTDRPINHREDHYPRHTTRKNICMIYVLEILRSGLPDCWLPELAAILWRCTESF